MDEKIIIGVDLGGTKIMTGAIDFNGMVLGSPVKTDTIGNDTADAILKRVTDSVEKVLHSLNRNTRDVEGIGIGCTGPLDIDKGLILECPQLPNMHFFPLRRTIEDYFGVPVYLNNDANCLIYGETVFGAAVNNRNVVGFTLGTGIGCAVIIDKKIFNGSTGTAAEIWISPYGSGIIEDFVSGAGVSKIYKSITDIEKTSLEVYNLALKGDSQALRTWDEFGMHLAVPIAWAINIIDPEIVVLGGSITEAYKFFSPSMELHLHKQICPVPADKTKVVSGKLGDNAGFIGAACLVIEHDQTHKL
ncbi:MAG: ROK family protein [Bacteroidota bacterium]|nr:ROK family protein [Bacteroidota bacterium]